MKLNASTKINFDLIFNTDQTITTKLLVKTSGKQHFKEKTVSLSSLKNYIPACQYIIHRILESQQQTNTDWYVNLPTKGIDKIIGATKRFVAINLLHDLGIIRINHHYNSSGYQTRKFSKSYLINPLYTGGEIHHIEVHFKGEIHQTDVHNNALSNLETHNKGEIHQGNVHDDILTNHNTSNTPVVSTPIHILYQLKNLCRIGDCKLSVGTKTNRVFTSINRMKKVDRKNLIDDNGKTFAELDFKTSHLQQLIRVLREDIKSGEYVPPFEKKAFYSEIITFKDIVLNSDFYNEFCLAYMNKFHKQIVRDQAKRMVMYWLANSYNNWNGVKLLKELYPMINNYVETVNGLTKNKLSIKLQRSEAYLLNELVFERLAVNHPACIAYGMFDGLLIDQESISIVKSIVLEEGAKYLGFNPVFSIKNQLKEIPVVVPDVFKNIGFADAEEEKSFKNFIKEVDQLIINQFNRNLYDEEVIDLLNTYRERTTSKK